MSLSVFRSVGFSRLLLLTATIIWGLAFVVMKDAIEVWAPSQLVGVRFLLAGLILLALFPRAVASNLSGRLVRIGIVLGVLYYLGFWVQTVGLTDTTPGKNAFLTAAYVVMVPFAYWILARVRPSALNLAAAVVCFAGIGFVSLDGALRLGFGDGMTVLSAAFFALQIAVLGKHAADFNPLALSCVQFLACGVVGIGWGLASEPLPDPAAALAPSALAGLAYLTVGSSCVAGLFQMLGQRRVPASQASLILSLEGVFGVLFSVLLYNEELTAKIVFGFVLIFFAIVASETMAGKEFKWRKKTISS